MPVVSPDAKDMFVEGRVGNPKAKLTTLRFATGILDYGIDPKGIDNKDLICFTPFFCGTESPFFEVGQSIGRSWGQVET